MEHLSDIGLNIDMHVLVLVKRSQRFSEGWRNGLSCLPWHLYMSISVHQTYTLLCKIRARVSSMDIAGHQVPIQVSIGGISTRISSLNVILNKVWSRVEWSMCENVVIHEGGLPFTNITLIMGWAYRFGLFSSLRAVQRNKNG